MNHRRLVVLGALISTAFAPLGCGEGSAASEGGTSTGSTTGDESSTGPSDGGESDSTESGESSDTGTEPPGPIQIADGQLSPTGIAVNASTVFWANRDAGTIVSCPLAGCGDDEPSVVVANAGTPLGISVDATHVYWINAVETIDGANQGRAYRCPLTGCEPDPELLLDTAVGNQTKDILVDGDAFYFTAWPFLGQCAKSGCLVDGATTLATGPYVTVASDADHLYLGKYGWLELDRCSPDDCEATLETVLSNLYPMSVAVDEAHIYLIVSGYLVGNTDDPPVIARCPIDDCNADTLETFLAGDISPYELTLNDERVFYTNVEHGTVMSEPK